MRYGKEAKAMHRELWMRQVLAMLHETELNEVEQKMVNVCYNLDMGVGVAVKRVRERREIVERGEGV